MNGGGQNKEEEAWKVDGLVWEHARSMVLACAKSKAFLPNLPVCINMDLCLGYHRDLN